MHVVINAFSARRGGGQTYLFNLLRHLEQGVGVKISILAPGSLSLPEHPAVTRIEVNWPTENPLLRTLWEIFLLPRLLAEVEADVLFCPGGLINTRAPKGCSTVTMFRNMMPFDLAVRKKYPLGLMRVRNWLLERVMLSSMTRADLVIFISEFARRVIEEKAGGRLGRAVTIPHGINDHFRVERGGVHPRPQWLPEGEYFLYVSILDVYKKQIEVVRGYHRLTSSRPNTGKLVLAGHRSSPYAQQVLDEIERLGLCDSVLLPGNVPYQELPQLYANAKVNIFASTCENCPNILLEALGGGRPMLVSECQPMPEFGADAVVYFDPFSPDDFADKLQRLLDDDEALAAYGEKARKRAELYNWENTAAATWRTIRSLITY